MARPADFAYPSATLQSKVDAYFADCEKRKRVPSVPGLCYKLDITTRKYHRIIKAAESDEKYAGYQREHAKILQRAQLRMCDELEQSNQPMAMFKLKQPIYANYKDRPETEVNNDIKVTVKLDGMGKGENPFK